MKDNNTQFETRTTNKHFYIFNTEIFGIPGRFNRFSNEIKRFLYTSKYRKHTGTNEEQYLLISCICLISYDSDVIFLVYGSYLITKKHGNADKNKLDSFVPLDPIILKGTQVRIHYHDAFEMKTSIRNKSEAKETTLDAVSQCKNQFSVDLSYTMALMGNPPSVTTKDGEVHPSTSPGL